ncbi:MAG: hypothetical protein AAF631_02860 [Pseudomonadota bacterium]
MRRLALLALPAALMACTPEPPVARMSLADAQLLCTERATRYAELPIRGIGLQAETPDSFMVERFYKSCVFANAGVRPKEVPKIPVYS